MNNHSFAVTSLYLCTECDAVSTSSTQCGSCTSTALIGLWRFIPPAQTSARILRPVVAERKPNAFYRPARFDVPVSIAS